jgi:hypothetical protein
MWEDGFCRPRVAECLADMSGGEDPVRKAFIKMSIQLYNYGEGWVLYWVGAVQVQVQAVEFGRSRVVCNFFPTFQSPLPA